MRRLAGFLLIIAFFCLTGVVSGEVQPSQTGEAPTITSSKIDTGDTAWILVSTALVMLMTPGLALFYGGMVRGKNVLGTIMQNFFAISLVSVQWILIGYSLAFGPDVHGIIGNLDWIGLKGVGVDPNPDYAPTILPYCVYDVPGYVRCDNTCIDHRRFRRKNEVLIILFVYLIMVNTRL